MAIQPGSNDKMVDISASVHLKDTDRHEQENRRERRAIKTNKSEEKRQAIQSTLDKMVDSSDNSHLKEKRKTNEHKKLNE